MTEINKRATVVRNAEYDNVTLDSIEILERMRKRSAGSDLCRANPAPKRGKRMKQTDVDREIVSLFYLDPTPKAFSAIWNRFYYGVHSHACAMTGDWETAEDMVQETFKRAWEKRSSYNPEKSQYSTWLYTICHNVCSTYLKNRNRILVADTDINDIYESAVYADSLDRYDSDDKEYKVCRDGELREDTEDDISARLYDASVAELNDIDPLFGEIVILKNFENLTMRQISQRLGVKNSRIKNTYYKYRDEISARMKRKYGGAYDILLEIRRAKALGERELTPYKRGGSEEAEAELAYVAL